MSEEERRVIGRLWRGRTGAGDADAYEALLRGTILPGIRRVAGHRGAYALRRDGEEEVAFVTLSFFDSPEAVRAFAGDDREAAVVPPAARAPLSRFDELAVHYQVVVSPADGAEDAPPAGRRPAAGVTTRRAG